MSGTYVYVIRRASTDNFHFHARKTKDRFEMGDDCKLSCSFATSNLSRDPVGTLLIHQQSYIHGLTIFLKIHNTAILRWQE